MIRSRSQPSFNRSGRTYRVTAVLAGLVRPLRPCRVTVDGRRLDAKAWHWDEGSNTLRVDVALADGPLTVFGCRTQG